MSGARAEAVFGSPGVDEQVVSFTKTMNTCMDGLNRVPIGATNAQTRSLLEGKVFWVYHAIGWYPATLSTSGIQNGKIRVDWASGYPSQLVPIEDIRFEGAGVRLQKVCAGTGVSFEIRKQTGVGIIVDDQPVPHAFRVRRLLVHGNPVVTIQYKDLFVPQPQGQPIAEFEATLAQRRLQVAVPLLWVDETPEAIERAKLQRPTAAKRSGGGGGNGSEPLVLRMTKTSTRAKPAHSRSSSRSATRPRSRSRSNSPRSRSRSKSPPARSQSRSHSHSHSRAHSRSHSRSRSDSSRAGAIDLSSGPFWVIVHFRNKKITVKCDDLTTIGKLFAFIEQNYRGVHRNDLTAKFRQEQLTSGKLVDLVGMFRAHRPHIHVTQGESRIVVRGSSDVVDV